MVAPGTRHDVRVERGTQLVSTVLSIKTVDKTLDRLLRQESALADFFRWNLEGKQGHLLFELPPTQKVRSIIGGLWQSFERRWPYSGVACADYIELLFIELLWYQESGMAERRAGGERTVGVPVVAILKYIEANFRTTSLAEVAARFHYEHSYLGKQLKEATGRNYTEIVRELRLGEAKRLLTATGLSMAEVAERAGYNSEVHFFRDFRDRVGVTPGEYRKKHTME